MCGYCEEETAGEIDHFRPVSKCPSLVYEWIQLGLRLPYLQQ